MLTRLKQLETDKFPFYAALLALVLPLYYTNMLSVYYASTNLLSLLLVAYIAWVNYKCSKTDGAALSGKQRKIFWIVGMVFIVLMQGIPVLGDYILFDYIDPYFGSLDSGLRNWLGLDGDGFFDDITVKFSTNTFPDVGFYFLMIAIFMPLLKRKEAIEE